LLGSFFGSFGHFSARNPRGTFEYLVTKPVPASVSQMQEGGFRTMEKGSEMTNGIFACTYSALTPSMTASMTPSRHLPDTDLTALNQGRDKEATTRLMLEAREDLCRADERTDGKFKDVKQYLREEVARAEKLRAAVPLNALWAWLARTTPDKRRPIEILQ
jgi:hypothetical protein